VRERREPLEVPLRAWLREARLLRQLEAQEERPMCSRHPEPRDPRATPSRVERRLAPLKATGRGRIACEALRARASRGEVTLAEVEELVLALVALAGWESADLELAADPEPLFRRYTLQAITGVASASTNGLAAELRRLGGWLAKHAERIAATFERRRAA